MACATREVQAVEALLRPRGSTVSVVTSEEGEALPWVYALLRGVVEAAGPGQVVALEGGHGRVPLSVAVPRVALADVDGKAHVVWVPWLSGRDPEGTVVSGSGAALAMVTAALARAAPSAAIIVHTMLPLPHLPPGTVTTVDVLPGGKVVGDHRGPDGKVWAGLEALIRLGASGSAAVGGSAVSAGAGAGAGVGAGAGARPDVDSEGGPVGDEEGAVRVLEFDDDGDLEGESMGTPSDQDSALAARPSGMRMPYEVGGAGFMATVTPDAQDGDLNI